MNNKTPNSQVTQGNTSQDKTAGQTHEAKKTRKNAKKRRKRARNPLPQNLRTRFRVETYDGTRIEQKKMELEEVRAIDLTAYDCVLAERLGKSGYREPATGRWVSFAENRCRIEGKSWKLLVVMQNRPGVRLEGLTLAELTWEEDINPSDTLRLRRAFGERKKTEHYILSGGGIAWRKDATWIRIDMTVKQENGSEHPGSHQP